MKALSVGGKTVREVLKMTNAMIILHESVRLMKEGVLKGTGEYIEVEDADGNKRQLEMPETIHTFNGWKERGYSVKKGEKSNIKFPIWKYSSKQIESEDGEETEKANMFMKMSAFFTAEQVEPIKKS